MISGKPEDRWTPFKAVWPVLYAAFLSGFIFRSIMLHATNGNTIAVAGSSVSLAALVVYGLAYLWYFNKRKN